MKLEFRLIIGSYFRIKPYFRKFNVFRGFEISWLGVYLSVYL